LGVVVVAARAGVALGGSPLAAPERRPASSSTAAGAPTTVVVRPGDTLWSIATRLAPDDDPRPLVDALTDARGTTALQPGERIRVPG
jgi:Tfp pilus assembly protein FimV